MSFAGQQTRGNKPSAPLGRNQPPKSGSGVPKGTRQWTMPPGRTWLWFVGILLANYLLVRLLLPSPEAPLTVPYTLFKEEVRKGNVDAIYSRGEVITGRFENPVTYPPADKKSEGADAKQQRPAEPAGAARGAPRTANNFTTTLPAFVDPG